MTLLATYVTPLARNANLQQGRWIPHLIDGEVEEIFFPAELMCGDERDIIDLLVIPHRGILQPGDHLDIDQADSVLEDWGGPVGRPGCGPSWVVAFVHNDRGALHITSLMDVPSSR